MYTLIGHPRSRALRVLWMLEELGVGYEQVLAKPGSAEARAVNPSGKVPVLAVGSRYIPDSVAICTFLADRHGKFTFAAGTVERGEQDSFTQFAVDDLDGACWNQAKHTFVLPEEMRVDAAKPAFAYDYARALSVLDERLGDRQFVMGDTFTVPDIIIGHTAGWAQFCGFDAGSARVQAYVQRVRGRPAFLRAWQIRESAQ